MPLSRKALLDNLVETFKAIHKGDKVQKADGTDYEYKETPRLVSTNFKLWADAGHYPSIFVNTDNGEFEGYPTKQYRDSDQFVITCYVKDNHQVEEELDDVMSDVIIAMHQDVKRGRLASGTLLNRVETETRLIKPYGMAEIFITVLHHFGV
jgi:hypothetical protein